MSRSTPAGDPLPGVVDDRTARAAWSRLCEPADRAAAALVATWGPRDALTWLVDHVAITDDPAEGPVRTAGAVPAALRRPVQRWAGRLATVDVAADLERLDRLGGRLLVPGDAAWPRGLDDLGPDAPWCLWVRGEASLARLLDRAVAMVGARACTDYGTWVAAGMATELADAGWTVVSGGAYGIDAAAHRGALAAPGPTVVLLAGGVDRFYPAGNTRLLEQVVATGGCVVSEVPPGAVPSRNRFLLRNRLIAASAAATVVVEAARRSGALATAHRATQLLRPLGAVPGPVTSAVSAGCHELIRSAEAVCVTEAADVVELAGPLEVTGAPARDEQERDPWLGERRDVPGGAGGPDARVLDALPVRSGADVASVARAAGLSVPETLAALGRLELAGRTDRTPQGWVLASRPGADRGR